MISTYKLITSINATQFILRLYFIYKNISYFLIKMSDESKNYYSPITITCTVRFLALT